MSQQRQHRQYPLIHALLWYQTNCIHTLYKKLGQEASLASKVYGRAIFTCNSPRDGLQFWMTQEYVSGRNKIAFWGSKNNNSNNLVAISILTPLPTTCCRWASTTTHSKTFITRLALAIIFILITTLSHRSSNSNSSIGLIIFSRRRWCNRSPLLL